VAGAGAVAGAAALAASLRARASAQRTIKRKPFCSTTVSLVSRGLKSPLAKARSVLLRMASSKAVIAVSFFEITNLSNDSRKQNPSQFFAFLA
jgi:hypothetical protein